MDDDEGEAMTVLGGDPGSPCGLAVIETTRRQILEQTTIGGGHANWRAICAWLSERVDRWGPDLAVIQTPIMPQGKTPQWTRSAVSLVKNAWLSGVVAGWCGGLGVEVVLMPPMRNIGAKMNDKLFAAAWKYNGRISEHARDAAQFAWAGWQKWNLEQVAKREAK